MQILNNRLCNLGQNNINNFNYGYSVHSLHTHKSQYNPNFTAKLNMPAKDIFEKLSGKSCAEQVEKVRKQIEKIAEFADPDISLLEVKPRPNKRHNINNLLIVRAENVHGNEFGLYSVNPNKKSLGDDLISIAKCVIYNVGTGSLT